MASNVLSATLSIYLFIQLYIYLFKAFYFALIFMAVNTQIIVITGMTITKQRVLCY